MTDAAEAFSRDLLAWFDVHGRKDLPWQRDPSPYRVWVSEIMLQQTQVGTVIGYFDRFMERMPDVAALAAAPLDTVLHLWSGLGYYARARNLHKAAQEIMVRHGGVFPETIEAVEALPGIGRSTAAAILSLSRGQSHAILDGNVKRVLARHAGIEGYPGNKAVEARLWELARKLTPADRAAHYTQAIMDLGATLCVRSRPLCPACPVRQDCVAKRDGLQGQLPGPRPRKLRPHRQAHVVIAMEPGGAVLLERRPPSGIWGGLWSFPQFDSEADAESYASRMGGAKATGDRRQATARVDEIARWPAYRHAFTHFDLSLHPWIIRNAASGASIAEGDRYHWYDPASPSQIGLATPVIELIKAVTGQTS